MITLTLMHTDQPLPDQIDRILRCFRALRSDPLWRARVDGGIAVLEITFNASLCTWHPHLHLLCTGKFIPQASLSKAWLKLTGDSDIVHVQFVRNARYAATYVAKYLSKSQNALAQWSAARQVEYIHALRGRKTLFCFGSWRKHRVLAPPTSSAWTYYASLTTIQRRAYERDRTAIMINNLISAFALTPEFDVEFDLPFDVAAHDNERPAWPLGPDLIIEADPHSPPPPIPPPSLALSS